MLGASNFILIGAALEKQQYDKVIELGDAVLEGNISLRTRVTILNYRAQAYLGKKEWTHALRDFSEAIKDYTDAPNLYGERARTYEKLKEWKLAVADWVEALHLLTPQTAPTSTTYVLNGAAWFRATCPSPHFRNGKEAVVLARRACAASQWQDGAVIDTFAVAKAESGDFEQAIAFEELAMWSPAVSEAIRQEMATRLPLYRDLRPYHEE